MAILTEKLCFLHVPKTSGRFIREALTAGGVRWQEAGSENPLQLNGGRLLFDFGPNGEPSRRMHCVPTPEEVGNRLVVTTVRHPVDWLLSFWAHAKTGGRIDGLFAWPMVYDGITFGKFVRTISYEHPGIVSEMFRAYTDRGWKTSKEIQMGGDKLAEVLKGNMSGVFSDNKSQAAIRALPPVGASDHAIIGRGLFDAICRSELPMILRYGFTEDFDEWAE